MGSLSSTDLWRKRVLEDSGKSGTICQMKASSFLVPCQGYGLCFRLRRDFMKTIKCDIMKSGWNVLRSFRDFALTESFNALDV